MRRASLALLLLAPLLQAQAPAGSIAVAGNAIVWGAGPPSLPKGSKAVVLEGDPKTADIFTMRVLIPAGSILPPHWHPRPERVTVISGVAELGFGNKADEQKTRRLPAGSFYVNPPNAVHYIFFPEETVLQLTCVGPWELHTVEAAAPPAPAAPTPAPAAPVATLPAPKPTPPPAPAASTATVTITNVVVRPQTMVSARTTLNISFDYAATGFRADALAVVLQFQSTNAEHTFVQPILRYTRSSVASGPKPDTLEAAQGSKSLQYDLRNIWYTAELRRPMRFRVAIQDGGRVAGTSDWIELRAAE